MPIKSFGAFVGSLHGLSYSFSLASCEVRHKEGDEVQQYFGMMLLMAVLIVRCSSKTSKGRVWM